MSVSNLTTFYISSDLANKSQDLTEVKIKINHDCSIFNSISVSNFAINEQVMTNADHLYLHCSAVESGSWIGQNGATESDILLAINVQQQQYQYYAQNYDLIATMKKYNNETEMTFYVTDSYGNRLNLANNLDFDIHLFTYTDIGNQLHYIIEAVQLLLASKTSARKSK